MDDMRLHSFMLPTLVLLSQLVPVAVGNEEWRSLVLEFVPFLLESATMAHYMVGTSGGVLFAD